MSVHTEKTPPKLGKADRRMARLAGQLRANLTKRKAQVRARTAADADAPQHASSSGETPDRG